MFISTSCADLTHAIFTEYYNEPLTNIKFINIRLISDSLYFTSSLLLYCILFGKIYIIFKDSVYSLSSTLKMIFLMLIFAFIICAILFECDLVFYKNDDPNDVANHRLTFVVTLISVDIILNVLVLTVFIRKLRYIILDLSVDELVVLTDTKTLYSRNQLKTPSNNFKQSLAESINLHVITDRKSKLIAVMTRLTVLCIFQSICNQIFYLILVWITVIDDKWYTNKHEEKLNMWYSIGYLLRGIEGVTNSFILYCSFQMNQNVYQCLCGLCDILCYGLCVQKTMNQLIYKLRLELPETETQE